MRYAQPFGNTDPDAPYINGNPDINLQGSKAPAEAFEAHQRELVALIEGSGLEPTSSDLQQVLKSLRLQTINFVEDIGSADAIVVEFDPAFTELSVGLPIRVKAAYENTGPTTIQVDDLSPVEIKRGNGSSLSAGDIVADQIVYLVFDGTCFQIENFVGYTSETENNNTYTINIPYVADSSGAANTITAVFNPAITSLATGKIYQVKIANTNTGDTVIDVNALPTKEVRSLDLQQLEAGQITAGMMALLQYDGTYFQLCNPVKNRGDISNIQIINRYTYQDPNYHVSTLQDTDVEAFSVTYSPIEGDNKVRVSVDGVMSSGSFVGPKLTIRTVRIWLQYSSDGGSTWNPPSYPGAHYPSVGTFMATTHLQLHDVSPHDHTTTIAMGFHIVGFLDVPSGAPDIVFRLMYAPNNTITLDATVHGGAIMEITEFSSGTSP